MYGVHRSRFSPSAWSSAWLSRFAQQGGRDPKAELVAKKDASLTNCDRCVQTAPSSPTKNLSDGGRYCSMTPLGRFGTWSSGRSP